MSQYIDISKIAVPQIRLFESGPNTEKTYAYVLPVNEGIVNFNSIATYAKAINAIADALILSTPIGFYIVLTTSKLIEGMPIDIEAIEKFDKSLAVKFRVSNVIDRSLAASFGLRMI